MLYRRSVAVLSILSLVFLAVCPAMLSARFHASSTAISARGQTAEGFHVFLPLLIRDGTDALLSPGMTTPTATDAPMDPVLPAATPPVSTVTGLVESTPAATAPPITSTVTTELRSAPVITPSEIVPPTETASSIATDTLADTTSPTVTETLLSTATASPIETPLPTETASPTATTSPTETALPIATSMPTVTAWPTDTTAPTDTRVPDEQLPPEDAETQEPQFDQNSLPRTDEVTTLPPSGDAALVTKQFPSPTATFVEAPPYPGPNEAPLPTTGVPTSLPAELPAYPGPDDVPAPTLEVPEALPTNPGPNEVPTSDTAPPELATDRPSTDAPTAQVFPTPAPLDSAMPPSGQQGLSIGHLISLALLLLIIGWWMQWQKSAIWHHTPRQPAGRVPGSEEAGNATQERRG